MFSIEEVSQTKHETIGYCSNADTALCGAILHVGWTGRGVAIYQSYPNSEDRTLFVTVRSFDNGRIGIATDGPVLGIVWPVNQWKVVTP